MIVKVEAPGGVAQITWGDLLDACGGDEDAAAAKADELTSNPGPTLLRLLAQAQARGGATG